MNKGLGVRWVGGVPPCTRCMHPGNNFTSWSLSILIHKIEVKIKPFSWGCYKYLAHSTCSINDGLVWKAAQESLSPGSETGGNWTHHVPSCRLDSSSGKWGDWNVSLSRAPDHSAVAISPDDHPSPTLLHCFSTVLRGNSTEVTGVATASLWEEDSINWTLSARHQSRYYSYPFILPLKPLSNVWCGYWLSLNMIMYVTFPKWHWEWQHLYFHSYLACVPTTFAFRRSQDAGKIENSPSIKVSKYCYWQQSLF